MSPDLVRRFAELVAEPGTPASYLDLENQKTGIDSLQAASQSRRAYFVVVRATILAIDCDGAALVPVLDTIAAQLIADGLVPVMVLSGGEGRRHLFCLILDPRTMRAYKAHVRGLGHGKDLEVRDTIRPPLSPHRLGVPVALLSPEDPAEAIAALTPKRRKPLAPKWMDLLQLGAPAGQRSEKIQGLALAAVNAGWTFGQFYCAMMDPVHRGGEKVQIGRSERSAVTYLEVAWQKAEALATRRPPVQDLPETLALLARMRARLETWAWPTRSGETCHRVLAAYLTIAERTGKLVFAASVREVAERAGVSIGMAVKATKWLRESGWLQLHSGYKRGTGEAAIWRVTFPHGAALTTEQVRRLTLQGRPVNTQYQGGAEETVHGPAVVGEEGTESVPGTAAGDAKQRRRLLRRADQPPDPAAPRLRVDGLVTESVHGTAAAIEPAPAGTEGLPQTAGAHDLWRAGGLGARAGSIYRRLSRKPIPVTALAVEFALRAHTIRYQLRRLAAYGLAVRTPAGWLRGNADLDAVAAELGVAGKGAAQRDEHIIQRMQFKQRLDEGGLGRGKDGR